MRLIKAHAVAYRHQAKAVNPASIFGLFVSDNGPIGQLPRLLVVMSSTSEERSKLLVRVRMFCVHHRYQILHQICVDSAKAFLGYLENFLNAWVVGAVNMTSG